MTANLVELYFGGVGDMKSLGEVLAFMLFVGFICYVINPEGTSEVVGKSIRTFVTALEGK